MLSLHRAICLGTIPWGELHFDSQRVLKAPPDLADEGIAVVGGGLRRQREDGQPVVEEGSAAAFSVCRFQGNGLEETRVSVQDGKNLFISSAF